MLAVLLQKLDTFSLVGYFFSLMLLLFPFSLDTFSHLLRYFFPIAGRHEILTASRWLALSFCDDVKIHKSFRDVFCLFYVTLLGVCV